MSKDDLIVGLDIGTTKVCCIVGEVVEAGANPLIDIVGIGSVTCTGMRKGIVTNIEATVKSITLAVKEAEMMAGVKISTVYTGVAGWQEAKVQVVTEAVSSVQNIIKCANLAGLNVAEICLEPIASSEAVLGPNEKEIGVVLVDLGAGTSDIAIFKSSVIVYTGVLPIGGNHITNDIAVGLEIPPSEAEKLKIRYGCAMTALVKPEEQVEFAGVGGEEPKRISRRFLAEIIESRVEEIFSLVQREIMKSGHQDLLLAGVVITGGACILEGMPELGEFVFNMPVRRGFPQNIGGLRDVVNSPKFATGVGLLKYGARNMEKTNFPIREENIYDKVRGSMRAWIKDLF